MKPLWLMECLLFALPGERAGLTSSSHPALDFRTNGFALPMYAIFVPAAVLFLYGVRRIVRRWGGRSRAGEARGLSAGWLSRVALLGLLQRRMLRLRFPGWTHLFIFWGFVILALGSLLIFIDSYVLSALGLSPSRGIAYRIFQALLDAAGVALIIGVSLALLRRLVMRREASRGDPRMLPILLMLLCLGLSGFVLEGLRIRIEEKTVEPWSFAGSAVARLIGASGRSSSATVIAYDAIWWGHAVIAFGLIALFPYSRLRHAFTSPVNILISSPHVEGALNTPFDLKELVSAGSFDVDVGAETIADFSRRERIALSACVDFGLCQEVCPAHQTGTPLSPRNLVSSLREASESRPPEDGHSPALFEGLLTPDEVWSCTLCGACTRACPVLVDPLRPIVELRRGLVAANKPGKSRIDVLANLTRAGNPYGSPRSERDRLPSELGVRRLSEDPDVDILYWIGCAATYDPRVRSTAEAMIRILNKAGVRFGILGGEECCTGDLARRIGEEGLFQELACRNIETFKRYGVRKILTHCAHCFNTLRNEYPAFGARLEVIHHASMIDELIRAGRIRPTREVAGTATLHDSCYVARFNRQTSAPRSVLGAIPGLRIEEMARSGEDTFCCGAGGGQYWYEVPRRTKINETRLQEAAESGAGLLVSECPYCLKMFEDGLISSGRSNAMRVRDLAEVVADSLESDSGE